MSKNYLSTIKISHVIPLRNDQHYFLNNNVEPSMKQAERLENEKSQLKDKMLYANEINPRKLTPTR